ncbi:MAG: hypothetical protein NZ483_01530 [Verrucomicrobiae bacterium]|nr:hypothetical protein [Verrucomicrobiae bacterium]
MKVASIGTGRVGFTRMLTRAMLAVRELRDTHFAINDINARNLEMVSRLYEQDIRENRLLAGINVQRMEKKPPCAGMSAC